MIDKPLLLDYLNSIKENKHFNANIEKVTGARMLFDILVKGNKDNEALMITFLNKTFMESTSNGKIILIRKVLNEIATVFDENENMKYKGLLQLLFNEMKGTPGLTISNKANNKINQIYHTVINQNEIKIDASFKSFSLSSNTTLYELLTIIMIELHINIDIYSLKYSINNSAINDLHYTHLDYLSSLQKLFHINHKINPEIAIQLKSRVRNNISNRASKLAYYDNNGGIRESIRKLLNRLFLESNKVVIHNLFHYLNNKKLHQKMTTIFPKNKPTLIKHKTMMSQMEMYSDESLLVLHLLIGFDNADINIPYFRNNNPEQNIRLQIDKIVTKHFENNNDNQHSGGNSLQACDSIFSNQYMINYNDHLTILYKVDKARYFTNESEDNHKEYYNYGNNFVFARKQVNQILDEIPVNKSIRLKNKPQDLFAFGEYLLTLISIDDKSFLNNLSIHNVIQEIESVGFYDIFQQNINSVIYNLFLKIVNNESNSDTFSLQLFTKINLLLDDHFIQSPLFNSFILFSSDLIECFISNSNKTKTILSDDFVHLNLLKLFSIKNIQQNTTAKKDGLFICFVQKLIPKNLFNLVINVIKSRYDHLNEINKDMQLFLNAIIEEMPLSFNFSIANRINNSSRSVWLLNAILIQLYHSHQYINYTRDNNLRIMNNVSLYDLISSKQDSISKLYFSYETSYSGKNHYKIIKDVLSNIKEVNNGSGLYSYEGNANCSLSDFFVSNIFYKCDQYQLIGIIVIEGKNSSKIASYCLNMSNNDQGTMMTYKFDADKKFRCSSSLKCYDYLMQVYNGLSIINLKRESDEVKEYYFFYYKIKGKDRNRNRYYLNLNNINQVFMTKYYQIAFIKYLQLNILLEDDILKQLFKRYRRKINSNEFTQEAIEKMILNYDSIYHKKINLLLND